jgi:hypothetical protein
MLMVAESEFDHGYQTIPDLPVLAHAALHYNERMVFCRSARLQKVFLIRGWGMHRFQVICIGSLVFLLTVAPVWSQGIHRKPIKPPELPKFDLSGTLEHIERGRIELKTDAGYSWVLMPKRDLKVELTGKAKPKILAPGQFIEFLAKLDMQRGSTVEKVVRMTIFTPDKRRMPGIVPDLGFGDMEKATLRKNHQGESESPADSKQPPTKSDSPNEKDYVPGGKNQGKSATKTVNSKIESFAIQGQITAVAKNGKLTVQIPENPFTKTSLTIEVDDDADINVELNDISALLLVNPGDHIQASGDQTGEGMGFTNHLTIRLTQVLGTSQPAKKPSPKTNRPTKTSSPPVGDPIAK